MKRLLVRASLRNAVKLKPLVVKHGSVVTPHSLVRNAVFLMTLKRCLPWRAVLTPVKAKVSAPWRGVLQV